MTPSQARARAAQACIDRFLGKRYAPGKRDCAILGAHALHHLGIPVPLLKGLKWRSEAEAEALLARLGFPTLMDGVDALGLPRIAPARTLAGDLVAIPCEDGPWGGGLALNVGNGRFLGFVGGVGVITEWPKAYVCAWRCDPCLN